MNCGGENIEHREDRLEIGNECLKNGCGMFQDSGVEEEALLTGKFDPKDPKEVAAL